MNKSASIAVVLGIGAVLLLAMQQAGASIPPSDTSGAAPADLIPTDPNITLNDKIFAMLAVIRQFESNNNYAAQAGTSAQITDFSHHPGIVRHVVINGKTIPTSASGAYQIIIGTWNLFAPIAGVSDFTPMSQDAVAYEILRSTGAFDNLGNDDVQGAFVAASRQWASLPGSTAGQNPQSMTVALNAYSANLG